MGSTLLAECGSQGQSEVFRQGSRLLSFRCYLSIPLDPGHHATHAHETGKACKKGDEEGEAVHYSRDAERRVVPFGSSWPGILSGNDAL